MSGSYTFTVGEETDTAQASISWEAPSRGAIDSNPLSSDTELVTQELSRDIEGFDLLLTVNWVMNNS